MEDDPNGRQPKCKTIQMEDDQNGRRPKWKTIKIEDDQNGSKEELSQGIFKEQGCFISSLCEIFLNTGSYVRSLETGRRLPQKRKW